MTAKYRFPLGSKVWIPDIEAIGTIRFIKISINGLVYDVTYWHEGKMEEVNLTEQELEGFPRGNTYE